MPDQYVISYISMQAVMKCAEAGGPQTPFALKRTSNPPKTLSDMNKGYQFPPDHGWRPGFLTQPLFGCTDWKEVLRWKVSRRPDFMTHQNDRYLNQYLAISPLFNKFKQDIYDREYDVRQRVPAGKYQPEVNGLHQVWCSKADDRYRYLLDIDFYGFGSCPGINTGLIGRIARVIEGRLRHEGIEFECVIPERVTWRPVREAA